MDIFRFELTETTDGGEQQLLKGRGMPGEELARVSRIMPYGFASNAPVGSHGIGLAVNGRRDEVAVLGIESAASRPRDLPVSATAFYGPDGMIMKMIPGKIETDHKTKDHHAKDAKKYQIDASEWFHAKGLGVFLGKTGPWFPVMTSSGPSTCVFASLGPAAANPPTGGF